MLNKDIIDINIDDRPFFSQAWLVWIYNGVGIHGTSFRVFANNEQDAMDAVAEYIKRENMARLYSTLDDLLELHDGDKRIIDADYQCFGNESDAYMRIDHFSIKKWHALDNEDVTWSDLGETPVVYTVLANKDQADEFDKKWQITIEFAANNQDKVVFDVFADSEDHAKNIVGKWLKENAQYTLIFTLYTTKDEILSTHRGSLKALSLYVRLGGECHDVYVHTNNFEIKEVSK